MKLLNFIDIGIEFLVIGIVGLLVGVFTDQRLNKFRSVKTQTDKK